MEFAVENVQILKKREARRAAAARTAVASQEDRPVAKTARKRHLPESEVGAMDYTTLPRCIILK